MQGLPPYFGEIGEEVNQLLSQWVVPNGSPNNAVLDKLYAAMAYAATGGGKRLRPALCIAVGDLFQIPRSTTLHLGATIELIHAYSLVHDDLPAMDNSPVRRGRPTLHVTHSEATAILVGDGLLTLAFEKLMASALDLPAEKKVILCRMLAEAAGSAGMVGGQMIDMDLSPLDQTEQSIRHLQSLKTGAMIEVAIDMPATIAEATSAQHEALKRYGSEIGFAFQIIDDLLDDQGDEAVTGKPTGQDATHGKPTYVEVFGPDAAADRAGELVNNAVAALDIFDQKADPLRALAFYVKDRSA